MDGMNKLKTGDKLQIEVEEGRQVATRVEMVKDNTIWRPISCRRYGMWIGGEGRLMSVL
jgi:hypothetical protein